MYDCESGKSSFIPYDLDELAFKSAIPLYATFELTAKCNFNCKMCYIHLSNEEADSIGRELTNEEWLEIARQAKDMGLLFVTLTGGEVFSRPHFKELYIELSKMGFIITILSNGYLIDEKVMEWLSEYPPCYMRFTLYGSNNEVYERVTGIKDGFDKVSHAIDLVKQANIPLSLSGTIIKENLEDVSNLYKVASEKRLNFSHTIGIVKPVRGADRDISLSRIRKSNTLTNLTQEEKKKYANGLVNISPHAFAMCSNYHCSFNITWNGYITYCSFANGKSLKNYSNFKDAWQDLLRTEDSIKKPTKCFNCKYEKYCFKCPGILNAECGGVDCVTDDFCQEAKDIYSRIHGGE